MSLRPLTGVLLAASLAACGTGPGVEPADVQVAADPAPDAQPPGRWLDDTLQDPPQRLSQTGLYPALPDLSVTALEATPYEPAYPLWSDGGSKLRLLVLPAGTQVDNTRAPWELPTGAVLVKTFLFLDARGEEVPIETRLLRRTAAGWDYAHYRWNAEGTEADRLDMLRPILVEVADEDGTPFEHVLPSGLQCRQCHESGPQPVLGFSELQLDGVPGSGPGTQLEALAAAGLFAAPLPEKREAITAKDETTAQVLGYFSGNCVHCHNGTRAPNAAFDLRQDVALDNLIDRPSKGSASSGGILVVPASPEESALFLAVSGQGLSDDEEGDARRMPPVGVARIDAAAVELLRTWISGLPPSDPPP